MKRFHVAAYSLGLVLMACFIHQAGDASSIPGAAYSRMTVPNSNQAPPLLADGGPGVGDGGTIATKVPASCMSPRQHLKIYNVDNAPVCCGFDANVQCTGSKGGYLIPPISGAGNPGVWDLELGCDGTRGVTYCFSAAGSDAGTIGTVETN